MSPQPLAWCDPIDLAGSIDSPSMVLLHSSVQASYSGGLSLLACDLVESVDLDRFDTINSLLRTDKDRYEHCWFGYFGYEMRHDCERYTYALQKTYPLPRGRLMRFANVYVFDHAQQSLTLYGASPQPLPAVRPVADITPPTVTEFSSNMSRAEYEQKAAFIIEEIRQGNLYQANLTRKFYGTWNEQPDGLALFKRLCRVSPAPYSAYLRMPDAEVLSSSPELFLKIDQGTIRTRPIKGSAPRGQTPQQDESARLALQESGKNRAENLMITDLMRHDLAKSCIPGTVKVDKLFEVTPHATIFHMASEVSGRRSKSISMGEVLRASFPPGSMTGAPKIRAVECCNALEAIERGIYSGAIGWFGGDGSAELSVVIRTLVLRGNHFEFQVGGGIVADSTPQGEWRETIDKALGILKNLNIDRSKIEAL